MSRGAEVDCDGRSMTVLVPLALRTRGGRKQVVAPEGWSGPALVSRPARVDGTLVKAIARAHRWQGMLDGAFGSIEDLARAERINPSYLARVLRLTLLAPDIVEAIFNGRHDPERITLAQLMKPFPVAWGAQERAFSRQPSRSTV